MMTAECKISSVEVAFEEFSKGNLSRALELLEAVIHAQPTDFDALNAAGIIAYQMSNASKAITYMQRALDVQPDQAACAANLGGLYLQNNQLDKALTCVRQALDHGAETSELSDMNRLICERIKLRNLPITVASRIDLYPTSPQVRMRDGDHWFALHLKQALAARGLVVNQSSPRVFLLLHGTMPAKLNKRHYNMMWLHSHPHTLTPDALTQFDHIFSLSPGFASKLQSLGYPATPLVGGTCMTAPLSPCPLEHGIVFVGNARMQKGVPQSRPVLDALLSLGDKWISKLEVWGCGWERILPAACIKGQAFDNRQLGKLYASSSVILNDHHEDMRMQGFLNPRILDVMGAGGVVISDELQGHDQLFNHALLTYRTAEELDELLERSFEDSTFRNQTIQHGIAAVRDYSFSHTADQIIKHMLTIDESELEERASGIRTRGTAQGSEAWVKFDHKKVIKRYKPASLVYDQAYNRRGEWYYLNTYLSPYFVPVLSADENEAVLENCGSPIGHADATVPRKRVLDAEDLNLLKLVSWAKGLQSELKRLGLKHRDINPTNILYHREKDEYRLIDFGWMIEEGDLDGPGTHPRTLNPYGKDDDEAIDTLIRDAIQAQITRINTGKHQDGSSTRAGWVYHPIAFDEFSAPTHKDAAINEFKEVVEYCNITDRANIDILEIGCSIGYFAFNLARMGHRITAFEADPEVYQAAEAMRIYKEINTIRFINTPFDPAQLSNLHNHFDLTLMLNVHMWLHKFLGPEKTIALMRQLSKQTKQLIFQTAHAQSGGMYQVKELGNVEDIRNYLEICGFSNVRHIRNTTAHGGIRSLFIGEGQS